MTRHTAVVLDRLTRAATGRHTVSSTRDNPTWASSLDRLLFVGGTPAVVVVGLVLMLAAAIVFARHHADAT